MSRTPESVWSSVLNIIRDNISEQSFKTWFAPNLTLELQNKVRTIQVPSKFFYVWLEEHYVGLLRKTLQRELGTDARLEYRIVVENSDVNKGPYTVEYPNYNTGNTKNQESTVPLVVGTQIKNPFIIPGLKKVNIDSQLKSSFNFDNFIEGDCNRLARSAGYAVAQKPAGTAFNPLVLFGGVGLGKPTLLRL